MSDIAISAEGLTKVYRVGRRESYGSLRETLADSFGRIFRSHRWKPDREDENTVWALRDVSFQIKAGEAVGVIGPNGAGKSTLLKILSRITEPTEGCAEIHGRVGSLLEVGTGFHPELSGRENICLNGAILGMRRSEIEHKIDEIVAFAEIGKFLDTPVKRYSSGMYVRLAFAVAAHLDPEIFLVDEVLSVGDAAFQKKCLGKMEEATGKGRTVLLVSHNMGAIKSLTRTTLWLEEGRIKQMGESNTVVNQYLASVGKEWRNGYYSSDYIDTHRVRHQKYLGAVRLNGIRLYNDDDQTSSMHLEGGTLFLQLTFSVVDRVEVLELFVRVRSLDGQLLFTSFPGRVLGNFLPGRYSGSISLDLGPLLPGVYRGDVVLLSNIPQDNVSPAFEFEIVPNPARVEDFRTVVFGTQSQTDYSGIGVMRSQAAWEMIPKMESGT